MAFSEDPSIAEAWADQFPKRDESEAARISLLTVIETVKERSGAKTAAGARGAALRFGIPGEEWDEFEVELATRHWKAHPPRK